MERIRSLKGLRNDLGYTQADVAEMIGVKTPIYSNWERVSEKDLEKIAKVLQVKKISLVVEM